MNETISTDVRKSTELIYEYSNLWFQNWIEICEEVQNKIIKSKSDPNPVKQKL